MSISSGKKRPLPDDIDDTLGRSFRLLPPGNEPADTVILKPPTDATKRMYRPSMKAQEATEELELKEEIGNLANAMKAARQKSCATWTEEEVRDCPLLVTARCQPWHSCT